MMTLACFLIAELHLLSYLYRGKVGKIPSMVPLPPPLSVISHDASLLSSSQSSIFQPTASESPILVGISQAETDLDSERQVEISSPSIVYPLSSSSQPSISQPSASESTSLAGISQPETNLNSERQVEISSPWTIYCLYMRSNCSSFEFRFLSVWNSVICP